MPSSSHFSAAEEATKKNSGESENTTKEKTSSESNEKPTSAESED